MFSMPDEKQIVPTKTKLGEATRFTSETGRIARQKRHDKMSRKMREELRYRAQQIVGRPFNNGSEALAYAAGQLFEEIVLNPLAPARARRETLETIAKMAQITAPEDKVVIESVGGHSGGLTEVENSALLVLRDVLMQAVRERGDVIDVTPVDPPE